MSVGIFTWLLQYFPKNSDDTFPNLPKVCTFDIFYLTLLGSLCSIPTILPTFAIFPHEIGTFIILVQMVSLSQLFWKYSSELLGIYYISYKLSISPSKQIIDLYEI